MEIYVIQKSNSKWKNNSSREIISALSIKNNWGTPYYLESGKPMLQNAYVSISHSNQLLVLAYASNAIGLDCEFIRPISELLIAKLQLNPANPILDWCKRESIIKLMDDKNYLLKKELNEFFFEVIPLNPKYYVVISSKFEIESYTIIYLDEMFNEIKSC